MTMPIRRICVVIFCAAALTSPACASGDHASTIGTDDAFLKEAGLRETSTGAHVPAGTPLADFAEETREPFGKGNESPGQVRNEISELKDQKMMNEFLNPVEVALIDKQLEEAQVRLAIAERRKKRDTLRAHKKTKNSAEIARLDGEVHRLKAKLETIKPPKNGLTNLLKDPDDD